MSGLADLRLPRPGPPPLLPRAATYWYHAESDCAFVTTDRAAEESALHAGCDRLERWEYESVKIHLELGTPKSERQPRVGFGR